MSTFHCDGSLLPELNVFEVIHALITDIPGFIRADPVGSRVTCNPAPTDTDMDILVLVSSLRGIRADLTNFLRSGPAWKPCGSEYEKATRTAFRYGEINIIVTDDPDHYALFMRATKIAKGLNLMNKDDRIFLFETLLDDNVEDQIISRTE